VGDDGLGRCGSPLRRPRGESIHSETSGRPSGAARSTWWYHDEGRRFGLEADLPAASGPVIVNALEREAEKIAALPGEEDEVYASARRADALVALCSARIASDPEPDRTRYESGPSPGYESGPSPGSSLDLMQAI
jgi:hypothetical protein